jgi:DNA polymerase-3 subunit delta
MSAEKIIADWKAQKFKPVYLLHGEEGYYIDQVVQYAEHHLLPESEAGFNLTIFYGKDANWAEVLNACRRYPMFAERQVVLLKEAQHMLPKDLDKIEPYLENPLASTIFVMSHKEKSFDKRKKFFKLVEKHGVIFTSDKVRDYQLTKWILEYVKSAGISMDEKSAQLLGEHLGNDLSRIVNEIDKVAMNLQGRKSITADDIERYVGISKEYNAFEFQAALAQLDLPKALKIIQYFEANPKAAPIQLILPVVYGFFAKLHGILGMTDRSEAALRPLFYNNPVATKEGLVALKAYGAEGIERALLLLHQYNLRSIGVGSSNAVSDAALLKELVVKIMMRTG